jgi:hypothetical protein
MCSRRQFLRKIRPIQLAFFIFIVCRTCLSSLTSTQLCKSHESSSYSPTHGNLLNALCAHTHTRHVGFCMTANVSGTGYMRWRSADLKFILFFLTPSRKMCVQHIKLTRSFTMLSHSRTIHNKFISTK